MADDGGNNNIVSSSKRRLLMTDDDGNSHRSSSVHQVLFNDDLLIEILLRLPVISLVFIKSVSKRWLSLITSPAFVNLHVTRFPNIQPPCGFFLHQINYKLEIHFVSLESGIPGCKKKKKAFTFGCFRRDARNVEVLQSCNGLVLCVIRTYRPDRFYVYNPSINMFKMLPQVDGVKLNINSDKMRLAFDPIKSPHYKVLHFRLLWHPQCIQTRIYSSETGCWRIGDTFPLTWFCMNFNMGVYWNDAIHWLDRTHRVRHFMLDLEHPHHLTTYLPKNLDRYSSYTHNLFESRGCLLLACAHDTHLKHLDIYEMGNGYFGWSLKYIVKYEGSSIPAFIKSSKKSTLGFRFNVLFIVLGEREEESFVVMEICGKVVKYNLLSKTLHVFD